jgi:hypothetical protein
MRNADQDGQDRSARDECERLNQGKAESFGNGLAGDVLAEVAGVSKRHNALGRTAKPLEVAQWGRCVEVKQIDAGIHQRLPVGRAAGPELGQGISGRRCQEIHQERCSEKNERGGNQPPDYIGQHGEEPRNPGPGSPAPIAESCPFPG